MPKERVALPRKTLEAFAWTASLGMDSHRLGNLLKGKRCYLTEYPRLVRDPRGSSSPASTCSAVLSACRAGKGCCAESGCDVPRLEAAHLPLPSIPLLARSFFVPPKCSAVKRVGNISSGGLHDSRERGTSQLRRTFMWRSHFYPSMSS